MAANGNPCRLRGANGNQIYFLFSWKSCSKQVRLIEYFNLANDWWHWTLRVAQKDLQREQHSLWPKRSNLSRDFLVYLPVLLNPVQSSNQPLQAIGTFDMPYVLALEPFPENWAKLCTLSWLQLSTSIFWTSPSFPDTVSRFDPKTFPHSTHKKQWFDFYSIPRSSLDANMFLMSSHLSLIKTFGSTSLRFTLFW